jgi:hypothetical protein
MQRANYATYYFFNIQKQQEIIKRQDYKRLQKITSARLAISKKTCGDCTKDNDEFVMNFIHNKS